MTTTSAMPHGRTPDADGYVSVRWIDLCERLIAEFSFLPRGVVLDAASDAFEAAFVLGGHRRTHLRLAGLLARDTLLALE